MRLEMVFFFFFFVHLCFSRQSTSGCVSGVICAGENKAHIHLRRSTQYLNVCFVVREH